SGGDPGPVVGRPAAARPRGRLVTVAAGGEGTTDERTRRAFFIVEPNRDQLAAVAGQLDAGRLRPVVESVAPFDRAGWAYSRPAGERRGCGKTVLAVVRICGQRPAGRRGVSPPARRGHVIRPVIAER